MFVQSNSFQYLKRRNFHEPQNDVIYLPRCSPFFHSLRGPPDTTGFRVSLFFFFHPRCPWPPTRVRGRGSWLVPVQMETRSMVFPADIGSVDEICRATVMLCTPGPDTSITLDHSHFLSAFLASRKRREGILRFNPFGIRLSMLSDPLPFEGTSKLDLTLSVLDKIRERWKSIWFILIFLTNNNIKIYLLTLHSVLLYKIFMNFDAVLHNKVINSLENSI